MNHRTTRAALRRFSFLGSIASAGALLLACSSKTPDSTVGPVNGGTAAAPGTGSGGSATATGGNQSTTGGLSLPDDIGQGMPAGPCTGLACQVAKCDGTTKTTITGKVYDPAGKVPLYNVLVYVPNAPVPAFTDGATCDRCGASVVNPVTSAITDETGTFVLQDAPSGANIPLVIQVGKWRRQLVIPNVASCADTPMMDPQVTRLPRNKAEGDIPKIAISVGAADQMECLPLRMGIDPAEFTTADGDGRIHLYLGNYNMPRGGGAGGGSQTPVMKFDDMHGGAALTPSSALWGSTDSLMKYDITILSCEGGTFADQKTAAVRQAMYDYESLGGRVFASHLHNIWFAQGPAPVPSTGTWKTRTPNPAGSPGDVNGDGTPMPATINQTFPKGEALAKWLMNVGASTALGSMDVSFPRDDIQAVDPTLAREWITVNNPNFPDAPTAVQYMSYNAPIGAPDDQICGRAVFTDLHVASVDNLTAANGMGFPANCEQREMSSQEKAVAFMLFDLSSCVQNEDEVPKPPK